MSTFGNITIQGRATQTQAATDPEHLIRKAEAEALVVVTSVNGVAGVVVLDTDDIAEPVTPTNQWFTAARVRAVTLTGFSATTGAITAADTMLSGFNKAQGRLAAIEAWDTDDLAVGTTNKYYTDALARACVLTGFVATTGAITATDTVLSAFNKTQGRLAAIEAWTTTNLTEGTNLYYTDARARAAITATAPVVITAGVISVNAASANTASYLVQRDASGDFAAGKVTLNPATGTDHLTFGTAATLGYTGGNIVFNQPVKSAKYIFGTSHELRADTDTVVCYSLTADAAAWTVAADQVQISDLKLNALTGVLLANASNVVVGSADTDDLPEGAANVYFTNTRADTRADLRIAAVKGAASGLASLGTDSKLTTAQIPAAVLGGTIYQGTWNANTNSPALATGTGTQGAYYVVATAGATDLDGVTDWKLGDWAIFNGTAWEKVDNTDAVLSVNSATGAVTLTTTEIAEGTNLYFTTARVLATALTGFSSTTGAITAADTVLSAVNKTQGRLAVVEAWTTTNLTEGTNLYYTDARVKTVAAAGLNATVIAPAASTAGSPALLTVTGPAHTTLAEGAEATDVHLNLSRIVQFAEGALTTQRAVRITNPSYAFAGASTLSAASTVEIAGAPVAHTNATITAAYALKISAGALNGSVTAATSLYVEAPTSAAANYCAVFATGNVGIGTAAPVVSALLELSSTTRGILLPRMTKTQRDAISSPALGLEVYQTDNTPGKRVYNGTNWMRYTETID